MAVLKTIQFILDSDGNYLSGTPGGARRLDNLTNVYQLVAPFDSAVNLLAVTLLANGDTSSDLVTLAKDSDGTQLYGRDVVDSLDPYYATAQDWLVWEVAIGRTTLNKISKFRSGVIKVNFFHYEIVEDDSLLVTSKGTFGSVSSTTGGDLPDPLTYAGAVGDYYRLDTTEYTSVNAGNVEFIYNESAYWDGAAWQYGPTSTPSFNTEQRPLGVSPAITPNTKATDESSLTLQIINVLNDHEERIANLETGDIVSSTFEQIKVKDPATSDEAIITYKHTNGNNYQVVQIEYPDGRVAQINEEVYGNYVNKTGGLLHSGYVLMTDGVTTGNQAVNGILYDESSIYSNKYIGVVTVDNIANNAKSKATRLGIVEGIAEADLYVSGTAYAEGQIVYARGGKLSNVAPDKPNRIVGVGIIISKVGTTYAVLCAPIIHDFLGELSDVEITAQADGDVIVSRSGKFVNENLDDKFSDLVDVYADKGIQNGQFKESFDFRYDGATSTFILTKNVNDPTYGTAPNELTMQFSTGEFTLNLPVSIAPTFGTSTTLQENWFYIPISTKVLTKSTSLDIEWTNEEHIRVAFTGLLDETYSDNEGAFINQNWNNHVSGTNYLGALQHIRAKLRSFGAKYDSGVAGIGNKGYLDDSTVAGTFYWKSSSGLIWQMHPQGFMAHDTEAGDDIHVLNDFTTPYREITTINQITTYSDGSTIGNQYYNLVFYGVANKTGEYSPLLVNVPTEGYTNSDDAINDVNNTAVYDLPRAYTKDSSTAFAIVRITMQKSGSNLSFVAQTDLRDLNNVIGGGGSSAQDTEFFDSVFRILNTTDNTKKLAFDISGFTSGNTRTLTPQNKSYTIADHADVQELQEKLNNTQSQQTYESRIDSTQGVIESVDGTPELDQIEGLRLEQIVSNGDFANKSIWIESGGTYSVSNNEATILASAQFGGIYQDIDTFNGQDYFVTFEYKNSANNVYFVERITTGSNTNNLLGTSGDWTTYEDIITATANNRVRAVQFLDFNTSGFANIEVRNVKVIPINNTPLASKTADDINAIVTEYFEGSQDVVNPSITMTGLNNFDNVGYVESGTASTYYSIIDTGIQSKENVDSRAWSDVATIVLKPNTQYHFSATNSSGKLVEFKNEKGTALFGTTSAVNISQTFTTTDSGLAGIKFNSGASDIADLTSIQIEEGTSATTYKPYNSETIVFKKEDGTDVHLRSVGEDVRDIIKYKDDAWYKENYVENINIVGSTLLNFDNTTYTNLDFVDLPKPSDSIHNGNTSVLTGVKLEGFVTASAFSDSTANENKLYPNFSTVRYRLFLEKGLYANLTEVQTALDGKLLEYGLTYDSANDEKLDSDGNLVQESITTVLQNQTLPTKTLITYNLDVSAQVSTNEKNIRRNKEEIDRLENDLATAETSITNNAGNIQTNADDIQTNASDIVTLQDLLPTTLWSGTLAVSPVESSPPTNTLDSGDFDTYNYYRVRTLAPNGGEIWSNWFEFDTNGDIVWISHTTAMSNAGASTTSRHAKFERDTSTTFHFYAGTTTTNGTPTSTTTSVTLFEIQGRNV